MTSETAKSHNLSSSSPIKFLIKPHQSLNRIQNDWKCFKTGPDLIEHPFHEISRGWEENKQAVCKRIQCDTIITQENDICTLLFM